jgi:hypothetical protein
MRTQSILQSGNSRGIRGECVRVHCRDRDAFVSCDYLTDEGADLNTEFANLPKNVTTPNPSRALFRAILDDDRVSVEALCRGNSRLSRDAVAKEARIEAQIAHWIYVGDTALHVAAAGYRVEIGKLLLAAGADPNAAGNHRHSRPLHYAADGYLENPVWDPDRQVAMIRLLLKAGAKIQAQDKNGATALHRAVRTRCAAAVQCLLEAGADPTVENKPGSTPFHLAVQNTGRGGSGAEKAKIAQRQIIQAFLERGVSVGLKDRNGKSVLQWAQDESTRQILLGDAG